MSAVGNDSGRNGPTEGGAHDRMRPRLLFLCQTLPYPPDGGVNIRTYNVMRLLARAFDITALCFYRRATRPTDAAVRKSIEGLAPIADVEVFPIPQEGNRLRFVRDHLRSLLTRRVYTTYVYGSDAYSLRLRELLSTQDFDLAHVDSLDLSAYLPLLENMPVVCTHHNIESDLLRRRSRTERLPTGLYLRLQAHLMRAEERRWAGTVDLNVAVSREDANRLQGIASDARVTVVPNGVDTDFFRPAEGASEGGLVFVGGHSWYPNRDGMAYFAEEVLPLLRRTRPDLEVTWVGRAPEEVKEEYQRRHGIRLTGYVDDIRPHVERAACYVVPLRVGGGTRLKILDAWAMGKAVVSTRVGCEGLETREGENILAVDGPGRFADAVVRVLDDRDLRRRLSAGGRSTVERVYDWDVIGKSMLADYRAVLAPTAPRAP